MRINISINHVYHRRTKHLIINNIGIVFSFAITVGSIIVNITIAVIIPSLSL